MICDPSLTELLYNKKYKEKKREKNVFKLGGLAYTRACQ